MLLSNQNKKQIGQIATDFDEWSSKSEDSWSNCNWFWWMVIKTEANLVKLPLISIHGHQNEKQIGQNNHFQTQFQTHSYILPNCINVHQKANNSKYYFSLSQKNFKPNTWRVWERVREKKRRVSFKNLVNGHFSWSVILGKNWPKGTFLNLSMDHCVVI